MKNIAATDVFDRVLDPLTECLSRDAAQRIVDMRADPQTQARVDELADKANEGQLTAEEQAEYDVYRRLFHFITILQAKAGKFLQRSPAA